METKWLIYVLVMFLFSSLIMGVCEHVYLWEGLDTITEGETTSVLDRLTQFNLAEYNNPLQWIFGAVQALLGWIGALLSALFFNYSILEGDFVVLKYILWMISAAIVGRLILAWRGA